MKKEIINKLQLEVKKLEFLQCWSIIGGKGSGSYVSLEFGKKIKRKNPLKNQLLSLESRLYIGEYSIFIEEASWRVESVESVLFGSQSSNINMKDMLDVLNNKKVKKVSLRSPALDLEILYDEGFKLTIFCNTMSKDEGDNYTIYTPENTITIQSYGNVQINTRKEGGVRLSQVVHSSE